MNPLMNNAMMIANQFRQAQNNPDYIRDLLLKNGRIDQTAYDAMHGMNPAQMGNYLLDNGVLTHASVNQMAQSIPQVQRTIG